MSKLSLKEMLNIPAPPESGELPAGPRATVDPKLIGDELDDEEFIKRTRGRSIHDPGMKEIFFACGGDQIVCDYATLAQAFDALRRYKQAQLQGINTAGPRYSRGTRLPESSVKTFVPGTVGDAVAWREKQRAIEAKRDADQAWLGQPLERRQVKRSA